MKIRSFFLALLLTSVGLLLVGESFAISASELGGLFGYTLIASTNAAGELEGADYDKLVKLDNGMVFEFQTYDYFYSYRPDVVVFAKTITLPDGKTFTSYKLIIEDEDEIFDVIRIR